MTDLSILQEQSEERALSKGIEAYWQEVRHVQDAGDSDALAPARSLIASHVQPVAEKLDVWMTTLEGLRPQSLEAHALVVLEAVGTRKAAAIGLVAMMRMLPRLPVPKASVCSTIGAAILAENGITKAADIEPALISSGIRNLKGGRSVHRGKVLRALARSVNKSVSYDAKVAFQIGFGVLQCIIRGCDLFETRHVVKDGTAHVMHVIDVSGAVSEWIDRALAAREEAGVRYPAMVMPPRPWMEGISGGYRFALADKLSLFGRSKGTRVGQETLDAINTVQRVPWQVNAPVYDALRTLVFARNAVAGLAATHVDENTKPIYPEDRADDPDAIREWRRLARDWHYGRAQAVSAAASAAAMVAEADALLPRAGVYFPHRLDFRTRVYSATSALSTQGSDPHKGILRFADGVPIGDGEGPDWLAVHGANCMAKCPMSGAKLDKAPFKERIAWVHRNHNMIQAVAADWRSTLDLWGTAETPFQFLAFAQEWAGYMAEGAGFLTRLPVALDGSCNGLQHYAALMKDPKTAAAVNLIPGDAPSDVYQQVAIAFIEHLQALARDGDTLAEWWLASNQIDRGLCKRPVMTLSYGVSQYGVLQQLRDELDSRGFDYGSPKGVSWLAAQFYQTLYRSVPAAMQAMEWLQRVARAIASEGKPIFWTNPAGSRIRQSTPTKVPEVLRLYFMQLPIKLGIRRDGKPDARAAANSIAPNIIHSFDAAHLIRTVNRLAGEGIHNVHVIHDSFGVAAPHVGTLNRALRDTFAETYAGDIWSALAAELAGQTSVALPPAPLVGDFDVAAVRGSSYFFA